MNNIAGHTHPNSGEVTPGEYVAGWAKRGPTGRIGNNKPDSASTVAARAAPGSRCARSPRCWRSSVGGLG